jgi:hypothetical protein
MDNEYGNIVKDVYVTVLFKVKARLTLVESDYKNSDGTDLGAVMAALQQDGIPDLGAMEPHAVISIKDIE